jgi:L-threonylcarbamoyladenylate synthase
MTDLADNPAEAFLFFDGPAREAWLRRKGRFREGPRPSGENPEPGESRVRTLSETGGMTEAAANLFDLLHGLDRLGLDRIRAEEAPPEGLGAAINDRLRRAAARRP